MGEALTIFCPIPSLSFRANTRELGANNGVEGAESRFECRYVVTTVNPMQKKPAVLHHYPCPDGAFAALAAHLFFSSASPPALFLPDTVYNPITPQQLPLAQISDVYLLDFVGPSGFVQEISSEVSRVVVLDHHKTALETLCDENFSVGENVTRVIDVRRSGATIAFDYFKERVGGEVAFGQFDRVRRLFEYIEDGDLWRWSLPNSKAFNSGLKDLNIEFDMRLNPNLFVQVICWGFFKALNLQSYWKLGNVLLFLIYFFSAKGNL